MEKITVYFSNVEMIYCERSSSPIVNQFCLQIKNVFLMYEIKALDILQMMENLLGQCCTLLLFNTLSIRI